MNAIDQKLTRMSRVADASADPMDFPTQRNFVGVDVIVAWHGNLETLAAKLRAASRIGPLDLVMLWPVRKQHGETDRYWRCRFENSSNLPEAEETVTELLSIIGEKMRWTHVEKLVNLDGRPAHPRAPGKPHVSDFGERS